MTFWSVNSTYEEEEKGTVHWLERKSTEVSIADRPYLANHGQNGYYRVNYDQENWEALTDLLLAEEEEEEEEEEEAAVEATARAQLYDDAFNLARAGIISYEVRSTFLF